MLQQIRCTQFKKLIIDFHSGLNVVMGDENGTNSIGKSTLLMVIDFAFGGSSLLDFNKDIVTELGDHSYYFTFIFESENFYFERQTDESDVVYVCDSEFAIVERIQLAEFTQFLKIKYKIENDDVTFRSIVGIFSRVWGKDNLNPHKPLHAIQAQSASSGVDLLLKLYDEFNPLKFLTLEIKDKKDSSTALTKAFKANLIPKISKKTFRTNEIEINEISKEVSDIKQNLAKYALNIGEISNKQILALKLEKDKLLKAKLIIDDKLARVRQNMQDNKHLQSKNLESLREFFPQVNIRRIANIEEFHSSIVVLLKREMKATEVELNEQTQTLSQDLAALDEKIISRLSVLDNPSSIVDRVYDLSVQWQVLRRENEFYSKSHAFAETLKKLNSSLKVLKDNALRLVEKTINGKLVVIVSEVYGRDRKSPALELSDTNYKYEIFEDTGTGKAYSNLLVFDLAIFSTTQLPFIIHDSLLFKNIENAAVARLIGVYNSLPRQSFIAIDEIEKYGEVAASLLTLRSVVQLTGNNPLYSKSWR